MSQSPPRNNNFDLIRLFAAIQVALSHALRPDTGLMASLPADAKPAMAAFAQWLDWVPGIPIFFITSGFLIARSFEGNPKDLSGYIWRRGLRIFPALWACFFATLGVLAWFGLLTTDFIGTRSFAIWVTGQLTFVQFFNPSYLRDFGTGVMNTALWAVTVELQFYVFIPILYRTLFGPWRRHKANDMIFAAMVGGSFWLWCGMDRNLSTPGLSPEATALWKLVSVTLAPHLWMFCFGILLHRHFNVIRRWTDGKFAFYLTAYVLFKWLRETFAEPLAGWYYLHHFPSRILLAFVVVSAAYTCRSLSARILRGNDISYGIYLYHCLVINVMMEYGLMNSLWSPAWVVGISVVPAVLSWLLIERPALSCKVIQPKLPGSWRGPEPTSRA